jgi:hypothetical protein
MSVRGIDPAHEGGPRILHGVEGRSAAGDTAHMLGEAFAFHARPVDTGSMLGTVDAPIEKEPQDR